MTVYNKASLVLAESPAYKAGKIQPYYPLTPDVSFDFTRATSATRVNASGNIEKETQNLLLQSNQFDTTWATSNASVTSGQIGYDGSNDAWKLESSTSDIGSKRVQQIVNVGGVKSYSVYAKAGTANFLVIGGAVNARYFDLANGSVGALVGTNSPASIESVGNGWYRCTMVEVGTTNVFQLYVANTNSSTAALAGDNIYIQDAQLEQGLVARDYQETTTSAFYGGVTDNVPRLDYTDGSCPSVLLEPQRTNLIGQSEYLVSINGGSVEYNSSISPEGLQNATKVIFGATTNDGATMNLSASCSGNTQYTWSAYVKNISGTGLFNIRIDTDTTTILVNQDIAATSEWTRVSHTFTTDASATSFGFNSRYRSKAEGNEILIWGAQVEEGSYATSYIPTYGTSVTRNRDFCTKTDATSLIGQTEGTIFLDLNVTTIDSSGFLFGIYGGSPRNEIYFRGQANNSIGFIHYNVNTQAYIVTSSLSEGRHKLAACYKNNDWVLYLDGTLVAGDTSGSFTGGANNISFGYSSSGVYEPYESVNQALVFKTRLSNDELAALTTL